MGEEPAWLYRFLPAAYEAGADKIPGRKFGAPARKIASSAGLSLCSFWHYMGKQETWSKLRWLVRPVEDAPRWHKGLLSAVLPPAAPYPDQLPYVILVRSVQRSQPSVPV